MPGKGRVSKCLLKHGKRLKGIGLDTNVRKKGHEIVQRARTRHPEKNISAGAGVFAIKNIRIDAGSSSVGQKKIL